MSDEWLRSLRHVLLDAGVAARIAARTELELRDHLLDLEAEARRCGRDAETAAAEARQRLGSVDMLAAAVLARPELRSWAFRWPVVRPIVRTFAALGLACYRFAHGHAARSVTRYAFASVSASVATIALLYTLAYVVLPARNGAAIRIAASSVPTRTTGPEWRKAHGTPGNEPETLTHNRVAAADSDDEGPDTAVVQQLGGSGNRDANGSEQSELAARLSEEARAAAKVAAANIRLTAGGLSSGRSRPELNVRDPATIAEAILPPVPEVALAGRFTLPDGDLLPIVKVSPVYPADAAARGIEGYVVIEYTVTPAGAVSDLVVIESSHRLFERSALDAAAKFRYKPRVIGGEAVAVSGVRTVVRFKLAV